MTIQTAVAVDRKASAGARKRIGLLVPSSNTVMENDLHAALPKSHYTIHTARMYLVTCTRDCEIDMIDGYAPKAAEDVGTARLDLLVFGCTSAGSLFGAAHDKKVCDGLGERAGSPALGTLSAVNEALARRNFARMAVLTPYVEDLTRAVASAATVPGRTIVAAHGMGIEDNFELATPTPEDIVAFARDRLTGVEMDGLFVSCTNFRAVEAAPELERLFGVPVVTSNLAVIEAVRRRFETA
ncbi:aspartate/glutamate racemase family protein [Aquabacter spiritensis]|uniref:Maleate isomerase n=1 Tax=Aquabacter spiritensis TaxID=933073 RepID=A0A4R3LMZ5_9HYPH|nr:aspartate/glutamate racemase family protein [Aquabacter spiritensis]TCT01704.1 maleate isomerase [Aquabacter spiritensis]